MYICILLVYMHIQGIYSIWLLLVYTVYGCATWMCAYIPVIYIYTYIYTHLLIQVSPSTCGLDTSNIYIYTLTYTCISTVYGCATWICAYIPVMYIYICTLYYMHIQVAYIYVYYWYICMSSTMYIHICTLLVYMHIQVCTYISVCIYMYICILLVYMHIQVCTYIYIYICT